MDLNWIADATGGEGLGRVNRLALDGDTLYAAGGFTHLGGQPRLYIGALLSANGGVKTWAPQVSSNVLSLAVSPKAVYLGGKFRYVGNSNRNYLAAIDKTTGQATSWDPNADEFPHGYVTNGFMTAIVTYNNLVIVAGPFNGFFGRLYLNAIDEDTSFSVWAIGECDQLRDLQMHDDRLYAVGAFFRIGGDGFGGSVPRDRVAALDPQTGAVLDWNPKISGAGSISGAGWANTITFAGNTAYVGGTFSSPNPTSYELAITNANNVAAFDLTSGEEVGERRPFNNGDFYDLEAENGQLYFGGAFDSLGGVPHRNLAELSRVGGSLKPWNSEINGRITALTLVADRLLVGGSFTSIAGQDRLLLAALSLPGLEVLPWSPTLGTDESGETHINTMIPNGDQLLLAGEFLSVNGQPRQNLAMVSLTTGETLPWQADTDGIVEAAAIANGQVYVGGQFATLGRQPRPFLGSVDLATAAVSDWTPAPDNWVTSLSANSSAVYSAGYFMSVSGSGRTGYAAHSLSDGSLLPWNLEAQLPSLGKATILARGDEVVATGRFYSYEGLVKPSVLQFDGVTGTPTDWNALPYIFSPEARLLTAGDTLFLVGEQNLSSGMTRRGLAVFEAAGFSRFTQVTPTGAGATLRMTGDQGREFIIERTTDFNTWTGVSTNIAWEGLLEVDDPTAPVNGSVFYRTKTVPSQ